CLADSLRHNLAKRFHVFRSGVFVNNWRAFAWNVSGGERAPVKHAIQNFFHAKRKPVGFSEAGDFRLAIARTQNRGDLAIAVNALVVHLDCDDALESVENLLETVRQWMEMAQMQRADLFSLLARHRNSVVDWSASGTPSDHQGVALLIAVNFRHRNFFGVLWQFVTALCRHGHMQLGAASRMTHFVVLESRQERVFSVEDARARWNVLCDLVDRIRFMCLSRR